jgi:predicted DNA-binding transcriptional regulator YafY
LMTRAPAAAIAFWIRQRGAACSAEILDEFGISESTLRRRRSELRAFGVEFLENGRGSLYITRELARQLPTNRQPQRRFHDDQVRVD